VRSIRGELRSSIIVDPADGKTPARRCRRKGSKRCARILEGGRVRDGQLRQ
jgi:hypothetical protein